MRKRKICGTVVGLILMLLLGVSLTMRAQAQETYSMKSEFVTLDDMAKMAAEKAELYLWSEDGTILWHFPVVQKAIDFTTETIITKNRHDEVYVEFVQEGTLPGPGEVTIMLGVDTNPFPDGTQVRLYYINPVTHQNELVEISEVEGGCVTFGLEHCSLYLITTVDYGENYVPDAGGIWKRVTIVVVLAVGVTISIIHRRRKLRKDKEGQTKEC